MNANKMISWLSSFLPSSFCLYGSMAMVILGGLWMFWNPQNLSVRILDYTDQAISSLVQAPNASFRSFFMSCIYASPSWVKRTLWDDLSKFNNQHTTKHEPWLLIGDFNSIFGPHEKLGGQPDPSSAGNWDFKLS